MPIQPESFQYQHDPDAALATITLNRPERLNALTFGTSRVSPAIWCWPSAAAAVRWWPA
jgi:enoyl-CoA hydratase/carnithine racemase